MDESSKRLEARNRLDDLFEVALVLTGVLAAALFQYITSLPTFADTIIQDYIWNFILGFTTFPFIFLILFWILKEVLFIRGNTLLSLRVSLVCWSIWGNLLFIYLTNVFGLMNSSEFFVFSSFFLGIIPVILVTYGYKNAAISQEEIRYFTENRWKKELVLFIGASLIGMLLLLYGFLFSLFF